MGWITVRKRWRRKATLTEQPDAPLRYISTPTVPFGGTLLFVGECLSEMGGREERPRLPIMRRGIMLLPTSTWKPGVYKAIASYVAIIEAALFSCTVNCN